MANKILLKKQREELLRTLQVRFQANMTRHKGLIWGEVEDRLEAHAEELWSLSEMERTGGEPDVVGHDKKTGEYFFLTAPWKAPKAAEVFATTVRHWSQEKKLNQGTTPLIWPLPSALSS